ncbi:MAG: response regulator [Candidatus Peribacteraceae bacterium]|nr:response regulator [Candidatus Peribacteraceae bacterium]
MIKHVLIAEDDAILADMMGKILSKKNVRVTIAYNGQEAIDALEKELPDLLLLDVLMPVLDGHAVLDAIQKKKMDCPVIVMSNLSDKMTKNKCRQMHVQDYFVKNDIDDEELWPAIQKYLR